MLFRSDKRTYIIKNGNEIMSKITGTGCMLSGIIAAYISVNEDNMLEAVATAVTVMGVSAERALSKVKRDDVGTASFKTYLIDEISKLNYEKLKGGMKVEIR